MRKYVLALDLGTTGNRAILFDHDGKAVASAYREFRQYYPKPGWVEHDAEEIWRGVLYVTRAAVKKARIKPAQIAAIGITNQRETTVVWNGRTGKPVYRAIVWQDRRTADVCEQLKHAGKESMIRQKTGLVLDPYFSATKLSWILKNVVRNPSHPSLILPSGRGGKIFSPPLGGGVRGGELKFGTIDSWVLWNLTGGKMHATDVSNASRTMLFNIHTRQWDDELLKLFKVPREILPQVLPSSNEFGTLDSNILGAPIPITGMCGDQQAALFGQTCFNRGDLKITYGTGAFLLLNVGKKPIIPKEPLIATIAWQIGNEITYALEGSVFSCGAAINWLQNNLGIIKNGPDADKLASCVSDSGGVTVVPAFSGLGAPYWDPQARGVISGLTQHTRKERIVYATLEAIAHQVADVIDVLHKEARYIILQKVKADGGVAKSDLVLQSQADFSRVRIHRSAQTESTALGAAMLAGLAVKFWKISELQHITNTARVFTPIMNKIARDQKRSQWIKAVACSRNKNI
ncbi:glycerol kinase [Candidatus Uhrbacteria bacterium RIFCSPLOWO2_01_FULL_47_24]|uniref:Glycerol kinase n=1 Tax=Candidatus Uhrbacteria bacterium RIFCSPLOWO2_01_FULL_47_24 TaxID=1802401 RepID=A0A1F7UT00_9BACT|nr:MAG: glycerol kinase [Candidatus Uhrbacteria bacterium RIFCSPHIGHO2_02_FULL_46_47]OGL75477.1 MAG: glycerol kinase [Candidatus Uhrbacteria bacterium RIFCSPHIGHO2_12_FULL_47_11]OGL80848.1 MAG: glycerol kinase [Candidatus Uhrbacteria bacterium RIFCSPLOWO2_01_FULL_47_24]OGL84746.1 MAG: glycerol kinase [Candidatus Uhrbacteria bacterium RIFCSPLOWO2_02_FULL_46_25]